jgi:hypothetical protein
LEQFDDTINRIRNLRLVQPPEDLTKRVMQKLPEHRSKHFLEKAKYIFQERFAFSLNPNKALDGETSLAECMVYFFLIAFAHLIIAFVLFRGLRDLNEQYQVVIWLRLQPQIIFFLACCLIIAGSALMIDRFGLRLSLFASLAYITAVSLNGFLLISGIDKLIFRIPVCGLVGTTFFSGVFLVLIIKKQLEKNNCSTRAYNV